MRKRFFLLLVILFNILVQAQDFTYVVYEERLKYDPSTNLPNVLLVKGNQSFFMNLKSDEKDFEQLLSDFETKQIQYQLLLTDYDSSKYYERKVTKNKESFKKEYAFEEFPDLNWEVKDEFREILGKKVQKATTIFRGRAWEVWFCKEIPISEGPWKLKALPGLILNAKSDGFEFEAVYINLKEPESKFPTELVNYMEGKTPQALPLKDVIPYENEFLQYILSQTIAEMGADFTYMPSGNLRHDRLEISFEWE